MIVCLSCWHASAGGATFCGRCGRSLGARYCDKGHPNPLGDNSFCATCQSVQLSEGARCVRLRWLSALLAGGLAALAWKAFLAHPMAALNAFATVSLGAAAFLLNTTPARIETLARASLAWAACLWLCGESMRLLPGRGGKIGSWLRSLPLLLGRIAVLLAVRTARASVSFAAHRLFGPSRGMRRGAAGPGAASDREETARGNSGH